MFIFSQISLSIWMKFSMYPPFVLLKLMITLFHLIDSQRTDLYLDDFVKNTFNIGLH